MFDTQGFALRPGLGARTFKIADKCRCSVPFGLQCSPGGGKFCLCGGFLDGSALCGLVGGVGFGLQLTAFVLGLTAGLVEFCAQLGGKGTLVLSGLGCGALGGLSGGGLGASGADVLACLVDCGVACGEFVEVLFDVRR